MKRITVDQTECVGCGLCTLLAEETFKLDKKGKVMVVSQKRMSGTKVQEAIKNCPVAAIAIKED